MEWVEKPLDIALADKKPAAKKVKVKKEVLKKDTKIIKAKKAQVAKKITKEKAK